MRAWQNPDLLESLIELALLQQLQDAGLLRLEVEVGSWDWCAGRWAHGLHDAGCDDRLLLLHGLAHLALHNALYLAQDRILQTAKHTVLGWSALEHGEWG